MRGSLPLTLHFLPMRTIALLMSLKSFAMLTALALYATSADAKEGWSLMKSGMNRTDTTSALGNPLFKNVARGFEVWLYDGGAEVLCFRGTVVAWTAPAGVESSDGRQLDLRPFLRKPAPVAPVTGASPQIEADLKLIPLRQMRLPKL
jgi:hypothetical protein